MPIFQLVAVGRLQPYPHKSSPTNTILQYCKIHELLWEPWAYFLHWGVSTSSDECNYEVSQILLRAHLPPHLTSPVVGGARQVLISREITLRHKELKIVRLTLICNRGKSLFCMRLIPHLSNFQNRNWTNRRLSPIFFIDIETLHHDKVEFLNTATLGQH